MGLFSGPKESQSSKTARRTQNQLQTQLFQQGIAGLQGIPQEFVSGWPTFNEQLSGPSNLEAMSLAGLENLAGGQASGAAGGQNFQAGRDVIADILAGGPAEINDYFEKTVQDPALRAFQETIQPMTRGQGVGGQGLFGSQQRQQESMDLNNLMEGLSRERTRISFEERARNTQEKLQAMGVQSAMSNAEAAYLGQLLDAGARPREIEWAQTNFRLQEFMRQLNEAQSRQAMAGQMAGMNITPMMKEQNIFNSFMQNLAASGGSSMGRMLGPEGLEAVGGIIGGAMMCWVAAVYFGFGTPQWYAARNWLMRDWQGRGSRLFRRVYLRHGRRVAGWAQRYTVVRMALKPIFVWAASKGK